MAQLSLDTALSLPDDIVFREVDGEAVILNLETGIYFGLDRVGTRIWRLIEEHGQLGRVLGALQAEYDAARDVLERDLLRLAGELIDKGLCRCRNHP
jgi:hypothetical protein